MASIQHKKSKNGKKTYFVVVPFGDKRKWIKAGNKSEARKLKNHFDSLENSQRVEKLGLVDKQIRIDDFYKAYTDFIRIHTSPATVKRYIVIINTFIVFLKMFHPKTKYLTQIKQKHIESYQKQRLQSLELKINADGAKPGIHKNKKLPLPQTVNYEISILRTSFIWAKDREMIAVIPTKNVKKLRPIEADHNNILTLEDCKLFIKTAQKLAKDNMRMIVFYKAFTFLLNTGLRSGELCNLTWNDIDLVSGLIKIQPKKNWTPKTYSREFFLNESSIKILESIKKKSEYIFTDMAGKKLNPDRLRRALLRITKAAGLDYFTRVHDLRHTFNSLMQMNGVDPATMGKILGHKDIETTMIYTHQTQEHLKKSINKIDIK